MKKLLLSLFAFTLFSCVSDDSDIPPANSGLKLVKIVETDLDDNTVLTSSLNYTNDQITKVEGSESTGNTFKTEFVYENQNLVRENHFENNTPIGYIILNYTGDRVTSTASREEGIDYTNNYTYGNSGFVTSEKQYRNGELDDDRYYDRDNAGNIVRYEYDAGYIAYSYDTAKNPFSIIYSDAVLKVNGPRFTKNNITKETASNGTVRTYTFTYNSEGYPTEVIESYEGRLQRKTNYYYE